VRAGLYLILSSLLTATLGTTQADAQDNEALFDDLIVFGDSLSDPGNLPGLLGGLNIPGPPYFENQFSNGPVYANLLDDLLGFQASRDLNFAIGGARSGPGVTQNGFGSDHVNAFLNGNGSAIQIDRFLASGHTVSPFDLFVLNIGGNDYLGYNPAVDDADAVVNNAIGNISNQLDTLIGAGARQILVPLVADTGLTPSIRAGGADLIAASSAISDAHNSALTTELAGLTTRTDASIYVFDSATVLRDVVNNPAKYGLTNTTDRCFDAGVVCENPDQFLFFDGVHPTAVGHRITASAMADTIRSTRLPAATAEISSRLAQNWDHMLSLSARQLKPDNGWEWFGQIHYTSGDRDNQRVSSGYEYDGFAASIGAAGGAGSFRYGAVASYGVYDTDYNLVPGGIDTDSLRLGGFIYTEASGFTVMANASAGFDQHDLERQTGVAGQVASGSTDAVTITLSGEVRGDFIDIGDDKTNLHPFARIVWQDSSVDGYSESGATGLDRIVNDVDINPSNVELGIDFDTELDQLFIGAQASWVEGLENDAQTYSTALVTVSEVPVSIDTPGTDDSYARLSGTIGYRLSGATTLSLNGSTHIARDDSSHATGFVRLSGLF